MSEREGSGLRTLATLGLAVSGPTTLLAGLITFATIPSGIPPAVAAIFVIALSATILFAALYLADHMRPR